MTIRYQQGRGRKRTLVFGVLAGSLALITLLGICILAQGPRRTIAAFLMPTPTHTPTPVPTPTATPSPSPTATPTATPEPTGPQDHYWLSRPLGVGGLNEPTRYYPYGSTAGGRYRIHHGVDFPNPSGTQVLAPAEGRVIVAGADDRTVYGERVGFYGQLVVIQLQREYRGAKVYVLYGHLSKVNVDFLQRVRAGDVVGEVGMTGVAIGPHLHVEVRVGDNSYAATRNPELWLRPLPGKGTIAGRLINSQGQPMPEQSITFYRRESPDLRWQDVTTYPATDVNSDQEWEENFVLGDVPVGDYVAKAYVSGHLYTAQVSVSEGETSLLTIQTEDGKNVEPIPSAVIEPSSAEASTPTSLPTGND